MTPFPLGKFLRRGSARRLLEAFAELTDTPFRVLDHEGEVAFESDTDMPPLDGDGQPVVVQDEAMGVVQGGSDPEHLADLIAALASLEAERRTLGEEALHRYRELTFLYGFSENISADLSVADVADLVTGEATTLIRADQVRVLLDSEDSEYLECVGVPRNSTWRGTVDRSGSGLAAQVLDGGGAEVVSDTSADPRTEGPLAELSSLMCVPLRTPSGIMGVIVVGTEEPHEYTSSDLKLCLAVSLQAAIAIKNAGYNEELKAHRIHLEELVTERTIDLENAMQDLKHANAILDRLAMMDQLTGLANRRSFDEALNAEWRRSLRGKTPLTVLMLDVDHFKPYNDHYGHQAGDECLRLVAQALASRVRRPADLIARYGGEEFAAVIPGASLKDAEGMFDSMAVAIKALKIDHEVSPTDPLVTMSGGAGTMVPTASSDPSELVELADQALYAAKHAGRNRFHQKGRR